MAKVNIGDFIPPFSLFNQHGEIINPEQYRGKKLVLFFYPKDDTPGCTTEVCLFRDSYETFKSKGAELIGISSDSIDSHKRFSAKHNLTYSILSDENGKLRKMFGVPKTLGLIPGRVTYIVDENGKVIHIFSTFFDSTKHIHEALKNI
jgi:thioredoxin-dependent peroxiredoxin